MLEKGVYVIAKLQQSLIKYIIILLDKSIQTTCDHTAHFFVIADTTLNEYEIITLIYNRKTVGSIYYEFAWPGYNSLSYLTFHDKVWSINV